MDTATKKFTVTVSFNGQDQAVAYEPHQKVEVVLQHAMDAFGITQNRHLMGLFREDGTELPDASTVEAAGVHPGEVLILRQSTVRGG